MDEQAFQAIWEDATLRHAQLTSGRMSASQSSMVAAKSVEELASMLDQELKRFLDFRATARNPLSKILRVLLTQVDLLDRVADLGKIVAFPPCQVVFFAVVHLLQTAKTQSADYDTLVDFFETLNHYLERLKLDTCRFSDSDPLRPIIVQILATFLQLCGVATKSIAKGRLSKCPNIATYPGRKLILTEKYLTTIASGGDSKLSLLFQKLKSLIDEEERLVARSTYYTARKIDENVDRVRTVVENTAALLTTQRNELEHLRAGLSKQVSQGSLSTVELDFQYYANMCKQAPYDPTAVIRNVEMLKSVLQPEVPLDDFDRLNRRRCSGTTDWILCDPLVNRWIQSQICLVWLEGSPGTGKSTLIARLIDHLRSSTPSSPIISFFFCRHDNIAKGSLASLLRTCAWQFAQQDEAYHRKVDECLRTGYNLQNCSTDLLWRCLFRYPFSSLPSRPTYWILDGLDELPREEKTLLLSMIPEVVPFISVLIASRPDTDVAAVMNAESACQTLCIGQEHTMADIERFVNAKVAASNALNRAKFRHKIVALVLRNANGSFLWVDLMLHQLSMARTKIQLDMLMEMPTPNIFALYDRVLKSIALSSNDLEIPLLQSFLSWVRCASRPLSLPELEAGLEAEYGEILNFDMIVEKLRGSLITTTSSRNVQYVQFIHSTLRDYLDQIRAQRPALVQTNQVECHRHIAFLCVKILTRHQHLLACYNYSAIFWTDHFKFVNYLDPRWLMSLYNLFTSPTVLKHWVKCSGPSLIEQIELLQNHLHELKFEGDWTQNLPREVLTWVMDISRCNHRLFSAIAEEAGSMWLCEEHSQITDILPYFNAAAYYFKVVAPGMGQASTTSAEVLQDPRRLKTSPIERLRQKMTTGRSVEEVADSIASTPAPWLRHDRVGYVMYKLEFYDDAIAQYQTATSLHPSDSMEVYAHLATALRAVGKYEKAILSLEEAIQSADFALRRKSVVSMLLSSAEIEEFSGKHERRVELLQQAHMHDPADEYVMEELAGAFNDLGRHDEAIAMFEKMPLGKKTEESFFGLVQMAQVTGNYEQARKVFEASLKTYPDSSHWHRGFASAARKAGRSDHVVEYYQKAIAQSLDHPDQASTFYYWLGDAYCFEFNHITKACDIWEKALSSSMLGPEEARLRFALAELYCDLGKLELAEKVMSTNCDIDGQYVCRCYLLFRGLMCARTGRVEQAYEWFKEGLHLAIRRINGLDDPNDNYGFQMLGKALLFLGLEEDARLAFRQRIYINTIHDPAGHLHRAFCDICYDSKGIRGTRYVCGRCYDIDLCEEHYKLRQHGALNMARCKPEHRYLDVSFQPDISSSSIHAFLDEIRIKVEQMDIHVLRQIWLQ